ncbi:glutamate 5-kinase [bacterium]|jgi:glutamate 5-kinase|nr:glutamate 5-kinase [bacterium]
MRAPLLQKAQRLVIKLGTGILTDQRNHPEVSQMEQLVSQIAELKSAGRDVVIVSSGAVGAGMGNMKWEKRPKDLTDLQACAAVGQSRLMHTYSDLFARHGITVGQVLLTHADLKHQDRHLNARNTLIALLERQIVPIVNENDAVSYTELKFGDNDSLSALVASLIAADLLVILTTAEGLIRDFGQSNAERVSEVSKITDEIRTMAKGTTSVTATGGMTTKMDAAWIAVRSGIPMFIGPGRSKTILKDMIEGKDVGTVFLPSSRKLKGHKRWIAFFHRPSGSLVVDQGAKTALRDQGCSLLPQGVCGIDGHFKAGEVVHVRDEQGTEFAVGIVESDSNSFDEWNERHEEIVHRDNLVIL